MTVIGIALLAAMLGGCIGFVVLAMLLAARREDELRHWLRVHSAVQREVQQECPLCGSSGSEPCEDF